MKDFDSIFDVSIDHRDAQIDIGTEDVDVYLDVEDDFFTKTNSSVNMSEDYEKLFNKPSLNDITLLGNINLEDLFENIDCGTSTIVV